MNIKMYHIPSREKNADAKYLKKNNDEYPLMESTTPHLIITPA